MSHTSRSTASIILAAFAAAGLLTLAGCSIDRIPLDGTVATESRDVTDFTSLRIDGEGDVTVTVGPEASLTITADTAVLAELRTRVEGGTLTLEGLAHSGRSYDIHYDITVPSLESLNLAGAAEIDVSGIESEAFSVDLAGAGDVSLEGETGTLTIHLSGAGDVQARGLASEEATVTIAGVGAATVTATGMLKATVSGMGDITYFGHPTVTQSVTGIGDIEAGD